MEFTARTFNNPNPNPKCDLSVTAQSVTRGLRRLFLSSSSESLLRPPPHLFFPVSTRFPLRIYEYHPNRFVLLFSLLDHDLHLWLNADLSPRPSLYLPSFFKAEQARLARPSSSKLSFIRASLKSPSSQGDRSPHPSLPPSLLTLLTGSPSSRWPDSRPSTTLPRSWTRSKDIPLLSGRLGSRRWISRLRKYERLRWPTACVVFLAVSLRSGS